MKGSEFGNSGRENWDRRYSLVLRITEVFVSSPEFQGCVSIDLNILNKAIYETYPSELDKAKRFHGIGNRANDFKVSAITTVVVYKSGCVKISKSGAKNPYCILAEEMFALYIGLANLADPDELLASNPEIEIQIYSMLRHGKLSYEALWTLYQSIYKQYSDSKKHLLVPPYNEEVSTTIAS